MGVDLISATFFWKLIQTEDSGVLVAKPLDHPVCTRLLQDCESAQHIPNAFYNPYSALSVQKPGIRFVLSFRTERTATTLFEAVRAGVPMAVARVSGVLNVLNPWDAILVASDDTMPWRALDGVLIVPRIFKKERMIVSSKRGIGFLSRLVENPSSERNDLGNTDYSRR